MVYVNKLTSYVVFFSFLLKNYIFIYSNTTYKFFIIIEHLTNKKVL